MSDLRQKLADRQASKKKKSGLGSTIRQKLGLGVPFEETIQYEEGGGLESDVKAETDAIENGFKERAKQEAERFKQATDTRFYCTLVFQTEDQKLAFLQEMGWLSIGDYFLDGLAVAKKQGVDLKRVTLRNKAAVKREDKKLAPLVMEESDVDATTPTTVTAVPS